MANQKFERFGKYLILDHLVDGGMAKICRARFLGEQSNKVVAIKMVQPQFSRDPSFVRMFQDELSVTFGLQHPNIAQTYDYGKVQDQLYTAMEYVDGANLKQFLDRLKDKNFVFPVEISVYIISQVCQGLHYAHTFTEKLSGKPLHIVHRDISPHNIMLTYDGAVKVIDFGIAKSNASSEATQAGTIKGKLSYLAPEYLDGLELDARYDLFAAGITLWEMLCSRKLFTAANDLAVLKQIQACKVTPPSQINPNVPKELDAIVMKALAKDRTDRYEDMDKFNRALVKFLYAQYPDFNPSDLSYFAKELFKDEIKSDKDRFVEYGKIDVSPYIEDLKNDENGIRPASASAGEPQRQERIELDLGVEPTKRGEKSVIELAAKGGTRKVIRANIKVAKTVGETKTVTTAKPKLQERTGQHKTVTNHKTMTRIKAREENEHEEEASAKGKFILILVASLAGIVYFQSDMVEGLTGINPYKLIMGDTGREISSVERPEVVKNDPKGVVSFRGYELEMEVLVDGASRAYRAATGLKVPLNQDVVISIRRPGHKTFSKTVKLTADQPNAYIEIPTLTKVRTGLLSSSLNYSGGSVLSFEVDGEKFEKEMPFKDLAVPVGTYEAKVKNPGLGAEKPVKFSIEENKTHLLE